MSPIFDAKEGLDPIKAIRCGLCVNVVVTQWLNITMAVVAGSSFTERFMMSVTFFHSAKELIRHWITDAHRCSR